MSFFDKYKSLLPNNFIEEANKHFIEYDIDKNGFVEKKELLKLLKQVALFLGFKDTESTKKTTQLVIMSELDNNVDGKISFNEFLNYFAMLYLDQ